MSEANIGNEEMSEEIKYVLRIGENEPMRALQYNGDNLLDVLYFTGKNNRFSEWFESDTDYVDYVKSNGKTFKIFYEDGGQSTAMIGDWIVEEFNGFFVVWPKSVFKRRFKRSLVVDELIAKARGEQDA